MKCSLNDTVFISFERMLWGMGRLWGQWALGMYLESLGGAWNLSGSLGALKIYLEDKGALGIYLEAKKRLESIWKPRGAWNLFGSMGALGI